VALKIAEHGLVQLANNHHIWFIEFSAERLGVAAESAPV
jgi:hypothetical protein